MKIRRIAALLLVAMLSGMLRTAFAAEKETQTASTGYAVPLEEEVERSTQAAATAEPTQQQAYDAMIALKEDYPEGMPWTNDNYYSWKGGIYAGGYGCAAFAFLLSDAAFGDLPARKLEEFTYEQLRVGDILRVYNNSHSVIILEIGSEYVTIAEGNYNSSIRWGRLLRKSIVMDADYLLTRYSDQTYGCNHTYESKIYAPTCTKSGYTRYTCTKCSYQYDDNYTMAAHTWDYGKVSVVPTDTEEGKLQYTCTVCGQKKTETISMQDYRALAVYQIFEDVQPDKWYTSFIQSAYDTGLMAGTSKMIFSTNATLTRAQVAQILYNHAGQPEISGSIPFQDVKRDAWYYDAVCWAYQQGVVAGTSPTSYAPQSNVTREELMVMLHNHSGKPEGSGNLNGFVDSSKVSGWAMSAMRWAVQKNILSGSISGGKTYLNPRGNATRAEAATIMTKYFS
ncbi:MAG: S-layer homology domain-containing protein [Clostridia bacterium]|nr:S-layer homology domain-containing protein [Clostridia bacterium]